MQPNRHEKHIPDLMWFVCLLDRNDALPFFLANTRVLRSDEEEAVSVMCIMDNLCLCLVAEKVAEKKI